MIKATVKAIKDHHFGRGKTLGYVAAIGAITSNTSDTEAAAKDNAERRVYDAIDRLSRGTIARVRHGITAIISPTIDGWQYELLRADGTRCTVSLPTQTQALEDAEDKALSHLLQNVWGHNVTDDREFAENTPKAVQVEILTWIAFQRDYKRLLDLGSSPEESHKLASTDLKSLRETEIQKTYID